MASSRKVRFLGFLSTIAVVAAACGQTGQSTTSATTTPSGTYSSAPPVTGGGGSSYGTTGGTTTTNSGGGSTSTSSGGTSTGGQASAPAPAIPQNQQKAARHAREIEQGLPDVHLWPASQDRIGITKDEIHLCAHAALIFADAFDTKVQDLNIFWDWVNAHGGVYGRKVTMSYKDDRYQPSAAVDAANQCKAENPFFLLGGIGFDQIPAVRQWAEQNHMLYIHHIAALDLDKKYSFSYLPSVEQVGAMAGQWIVAAHRKQKIGVIYRTSENWEPGHKAFDATLKRGGVTPVAEEPVQQNQGSYTQQIIDLQSKGAQVVFIWENALAADEIIEQAKGQGYRPTWLVFPFNQTTDTLGDDALNPPLEGIATWPSYSPGMTSGPYASYGGLIKQFQAQLAKYGSGSKGNDILWMTWLSWYQIYQLLLDCGPDCSRNKVVALLISGTEKPVSLTAGCPFDFTRNGHVAGEFGDIFKTFRRPNGSVGWEPYPRQHCSRKVLPPVVHPIQP